VRREGSQDDVFHIHIHMREVGVLPELPALLLAFAVGTCDEGKLILEFETEAPKQKKPPLASPPAMWPP